MAIKKMFHKISLLIELQIIFQIIKKIKNFSEAINREFVKDVILITFFVEYSTYLSLNSSIF